MGIVIGGMTISLDGFVEDRDGSVRQLYPDMEALHESEALKELIATTGAVVMGRKAFAMGDHVRMTWDRNRTAARFPTQVSLRRFL
jgi:hypothetical protein